MKTIRLTTSQALVRAMLAQKTEFDGHVEPFFAAVWAIFGHGNVAGLGEALYEKRDVLPTLRAHNEQGMVHAATAFAKASRRRRVMACTSSIGPGSLNMVTGAAVAHVNRLPLLLIPSDVFANRIPDPVLQQVEDFSDGTVTASDAFRPVSRYFDRITRPEQIIPAFAQTMRVLTDPAACGPATLSLCQDVQAEAFDFPESFFVERIHRVRRPIPDQREIDEAVTAISKASRPLVIAGGGVLYSEAEKELLTFCDAKGVPIGESQGGKSSVPSSHAMSMGGIGVSGTGAANAMAEDADLLIAVGTRLQDFTTGSWGLFKNPEMKIIAINVQPFDTVKHQALPVVGDARVTLEILSSKLNDWRIDSSWTKKAKQERVRWLDRSSVHQAPPKTDQTTLPSDAQVIGAVQRVGRPSDIVVCAAGGLPAELQKHWQPEEAGGYHMEYGFSCMGYELAGALGVKMAQPQREVIVMVGDGSYLMLNSEIATSVMLGHKLIVVLLDNQGYACINRLQQECGSAPFNNMWEDSQRMVEFPHIDFVKHAQGLGAFSEKVSSVEELSSALTEARNRNHTSVIVIDTDPKKITEDGGFWWDVVVPEVSSREQVREARSVYETFRAHQRLGN